MINRAPHDKQHPYVQISNATTQDKGLGWAARGLLIFLLSKPDDWETIVENLVTEGDLKRDAIYSLLKELLKARYIKRYRKLDEKGRILKWCLDVFERPYPALPDVVQPYVVVPDVGHPHQEQPDEEKPTLHKKEIWNKRKNLQNKEHTNTEGGVLAAYDLETYERYAQWLKDSGQGVRNPGGYAVSIATGGKNAGTQDVHVAGWLSDQEGWEAKSQADETHRAVRAAETEREYALTFADTLIKQEGIRETSDFHYLIGALVYFKQFKLEPNFDGGTYRQLKRLIPSALNRLEAEIVNNPELSQYRDQISQFQ